MPAAVSAADELSARSKYASDLVAYSRDIFAVKKNMVGDYQIKAAVFMWNLCAVKDFKRKAAVFTSDGTPCITEHTGRQIGKSN